MLQEPEILLMHLFASRAIHGSQSCLQGVALKAANGSGSEGEGPHYSCTFAPL